MKFGSMPYKRLELKEMKDALKTFTKRLEEAGTYEEAREVFISKDAFDRKAETARTLASIRHSIDTRDAFYEAEASYWNQAGPAVEEDNQAFIRALAASPFRAMFEQEFGKVLFLNAEMAMKAFSPAIIEEMQKENDLAMAYEKLLASAQIPFRGEVCTISRMTPYKSSADDAVRLAAWKAEGQWYKDHQDALDSYYDELVKLRDAMGRKLGYENYIQMGYYRMERTSYGREDVERFRAAVREYLVPLAEEVYRKQAARFGRDYPMSFADNALEFKTGNPKPAGGPAEIVEHASVFYDALSPETSEFFRTMREGELMDLLSTDGKQGGGYCTSLPDYRVPFIFANFNGTQGDVEVLTHEGGHAFAAYSNRDRIPLGQIWPGMEACEVHSMSMEFLSWPWAEDFFGEDADKFRFSHLASALTFIPYGTMVDHFQHIVYEHPDMTPAERHAAWKELMGEYTPWHRLDGEIPFYSEGQGWQRQHHIYSYPFYYIDYCLAQTAALEIWAMSRKDFRDAFSHYMAYTKMGGSETFTELIRKAGLLSPFDKECLRMVAETAREYLAGVDTGKW
ncbi:MAG: M3 family oligoendopeptidase [Lachnospiraceae bacterium]|nr:M3 family oligoendopeptidase [Lachnospiraceae bacterium]